MLGNGLDTCDTVPSVLLFFDRQRWVWRAQGCPLPLTAAGCRYLHVVLPLNKGWAFHRYLFNVGEGFQRYCVEYKIKVNKVNGVFLTRTSTDATGGLPGSNSIG